ncbi:low affinity iron permease family protein, partial [Rhizobium ruizarguesonis]
LVLVLAVSGPFFVYSETWQLLINTTTTIITFLMVFVLQNSQNRDGKALQAKLDELILTSAKAATKVYGFPERSATTVEKEEKKLDLFDI